MIINHLLKRIGVRSLLLFILLSIYSLKSYATLYTVENTDISMTLDIGAVGINVTSIHDKINNFEYLTSSSSLFLYAVNIGYGYSSNTNNAGGVAGVAIDSQTLSTDHKTLTIVCHANNANPLSFTIVINTATSSKAAVITTSVHNTGGASLFLKMLTPNIANLTCPGFSADPARMLGMLPQEIGEVVTLGGSSTVMGRPGIEAATQLPPAMNDMEVTDIYDRDSTGGIFFSDIDGNVTANVAPVQFQATAGNIFGNWAQNMAGGATVTLSRMAIGIHHSGDYHSALDYYVAAHTAGWNFPTTPSWLKEAGGIWSTGEEDSGGAYEIWPQAVDLSTQISTFDSLPSLYNRAIKQGTNVFYLNTYWEGDGSLTPRYLFKGDYVPRADLGGSAALIRGINAIHAKGGKVIMYLEPFIIAQGTAVSNAHGRAWAARDAAGNIWNPYPGNYVMVSANHAWQSYITSVAKRLVGTYGADGIFLDSWGERWNLNYKDSVDNVLYTAQQWNKGVLDLADSVLNGIRTLKSDAVVVSETFSGELRMHENGGSSADYVWDNAANQGRIIASPVRYGINQGVYFGNGNALTHSAQVYAAGHSLALNSMWSCCELFLKRILDIRRSYKDAMVYGTQAYQPPTGTQLVPAYLYQGASNKVITAVNLDGVVHTFNMALNATEANSTWVNILNGDVPVASGQTLPVTLAPNGAPNYGLGILVPNAMHDPGFEAQTTNTPSPPWAGTGNTGIDRNIGFQYQGLNEGYIIGTVASKIYQNITVTANTNYNLTCYVESGTGTTNGDFGIMVPGGAVLAHQTIGYVAVYTPVTVSFNSGTNTTLQVYGSVGTGSPTPYIRFDNFSLSLQ